MKTFVKPSGVEVEVNPNSYEIAESHGWKEKTAKPEAKKETAKTTKSAEK